MMMSQPMSMGVGRKQFDERFNERDGLVPTTISDHTVDYDDVGYHSDEKGFYAQLEKNGERSPETSGTSTPTDYTEDTMEMFMKLADWQDQPMQAITPSQIHLPTANQQTVNDFFSNKQRQVQSACNSDSSDESCDEERVGDEALPDILSRSVKGMTNEEKKLRRRELNRLAAQRSRQKKKSTAATFEQDVTRLTKRNAELKVELTTLEKAKTELYELIKGHFKKCKPINSNNNNNNNRSTNHHGHHEPAARAKLEIPATSCHPSGTSQTVPTYYGGVTDFYPTFPGDSSDFVVGYD